MHGCMGAWVHGSMGEDLVRVWSVRAWSVEEEPFDTEIRRRFHRRSSSYGGQERLPTSYGGQAAVNSSCRIGRNSRNWIPGLPPGRTRLRPSGYAVASR